MRNFGLQTGTATRLETGTRLALNPLLVGGLEQALKSAEGTKLPKCGARVPSARMRIGDRELLLYS